MWVIIPLGILSIVQGLKANPVECGACHLTIEGLQADFMRPDRWTDEIALGVDICMEKGYTRGVCVGAVDENAMIVIDSLLKRFLNPEKVCKELEYCSSPQYVEENFTQWVSNVMSSKPPGPPPTPTGRSSYLFSQMSDIHVDKFYLPNTQTDCDLPVCCRNGTGNAGVWGDYNCDLPIQTFEKALAQLQTLNPEFIIITGDMPPHDIWNQSDSYNMGYQSIASDLLKQYFPNTKVYAIYGNHACYPVNQFNYELDSEKWLLDGFAQNWGYWLDAEAIASLKLRGTYAMLHPNSNLRMISLNTQACNNENFYLWVNNTDPGGQIQWLWETLLAAEKNGEVVYLFGHYYPADDGCLKQWSYHLNALVDRFESIIAGMFFGHSHEDSFHVNRGVNSNNPTRIQYVTPSITTYTDKNPSFRIYHGDQDTKLVVDYDQYRLNLPKANQSPSQTPVWDLAYSFKELYGVSDMNPDTIFALAQQIGTQQNLALVYLANHATGVNPPNSCDAGCLQGLLCDLSYGVGDQIDQCSGPAPSTWQSDLQELLFPPWTYKEY